MNHLGRPTSESIKSPVSLTKDDRKPQRRTPWACDECRLRKRKCDGVDPCTPCQRSALDCSYHFRRPAPPQTQRIQMLEIHLRYVRSFLQDASRKVPPELGIDFNGVLQKIGSVALDPTASTYPDQAPPAPSSNKTSQNEVIAKSLTNSISHSSFIQSAVEQLSEFAPGRGQYSDVVDCLFNLPLKDIHNTAATLPPRREALRLINALFDAQHPMLAFLHEQYFRDTVDMVYTAASRDAAIDRFLPLLHLALGLGYLFCRTNHSEDGCHSAQKKAMQQYLTGRNLLQPLSLSTMTALQALLCAIVWLLSTCRIEHAHPLVGLAASLALRLGLHAENLPLPAEEKHLRARVYAAVVQLDVYTSLILGLPPFLEQANTRFSFFEDLSSAAAATGDVQTSAALGHLSLLILCRNERNQQTVPYPLLDFRSTETQIEAWRETIQPVLQQIGDDERGTRAQYQLEMLFNLVNLHLSREAFLDMLEPPSADHMDQEPDDVRSMSGCLRLAMQSVSRSEEAIRTHRVDPSSWPVIYTLFLSVVFMVGIAAGPERLVPFDQIQQQIVSALHLLAVCKCGNGPALHALEVLKVILVASKFDHIDIEEIASNSKSICTGGSLLAAAVNVVAPPRQDDIMALLNTHRQDASSTASMSRSPSTTTTADEAMLRNS